MTALLSCDRLTRRFGGLVALDALDVTVEQGSVLGLIGPNGSGKTTFFNVLTGIFPASEGEIRFDGAQVTNFAPQHVYRIGIARTFQRSRLCLPLSIFDNLMVGNHRNLDHGLDDDRFDLDHRDHEHVRAGQLRVAGEGARPG